MTNEQLEAAIEFLKNNAEVTQTYAILLYGKDGQAQQHLTGSLLDLIFLKETFSHGIYNIATYGQPLSPITMRSQQHTPGKETQNGNEKNHQEINQH